MDRPACIAAACALAIHALALFLWPAQPPPPLSPDLEALAVPAAPAPRPEPVSVEFIVLNSSTTAPELRLSSANEKIPRTLGKAVGERDAPERRAAPTTPAPGPDLEPATRSSSTTSLRMRGHDADDIINGRSGSRLQAIIASAAADVPAPAPRADLLSAAAPHGEESPWRSSGQGTLRAEGEPYEATIDRDGTIHFSDRPNVQLDGMSTMPHSFVPALGGHFDVTDAVIKSMGEVLYSYRKLQLMDQSREMRAGMAMRSKAESLESALASYPLRLRKLWRDPQYSLAQRKQLLFLLWDECAETGTQSVVATARSIRASTVAFIQRVLPAASAEAYTASELAELNGQRQSAQLFSPYADGNGS